MSGFKNENLKRFQALNRNRSEIKKKILNLETIILKSTSELKHLEKSLSEIDAEMLTMQKILSDIQV